MIMMRWWPDNGVVPRARILTIVGLVLISVTGCAGSGGSPNPDASASAAPTTAPVGARGQLAIRAAAAKDHRYVATYRLTSPGRAARTVTVIMATDGSWQIGIPGGAMSGTVDIAIASVRDGLYQCTLGTDATCVNVAPPDGHLGASIDPRVEYLFTDWLDVLTNMDAAVSVATAQPLAGAQGSCYSVDLNSASLAAPADPGVYCYLPDGTLTGASVGFGTLVLTGTPAPPPPTATLPGAIRQGEPLPLVAPPRPTGGTSTGTGNGAGTNGGRA